jgi:cytochrome c oxidase subunit IV
MPSSTLRVAIFSGMTIVKAFYIVGEFMHLKHEVKTLIWMVLIPTLFVVWLLAALMFEGGHLY